MASAVSLFFGIILRRKKLDKAKHLQGFSKCLTTSDLVHLGVGATLGAGTYVVTGQVAAEIAGPAVILSFTIAAITSILSGLCYAEFGARVPNTTGSAYTYSYVTVGEIWAFFIGWNLILEYMIGTAADAAALSGSFDYAIGFRVKKWTLENIGSFNTKYLGDYPDFLSFIFTLLVTVVLAFGVQQSSRFTVFFNFFNMAVVLFIIIVGSIYADIKNWSQEGGFFPYGASGVLSGAATCFYAFVGFDIIATTGEEAKDPSKSIPIAIVVSLCLIFVCYFGVSSILTLMVPYNQLNKLSPIPDAFSQRGIWWANYIISMGAICGLSSSLLGNLFPLPRIIYAMADDGLLFNMFTNINRKTEVPVNATVYPGIVTAFFALLFDLEELVEMMSIGTLLAYTLVSLCVLILRYQPDDYYSRDSSMQPLIDDESQELSKSKEFLNGEEFILESQPKKTDSNEKGEIYKLKDFDSNKDRKVINEDMESTSLTQNICKEPDDGSPFCRTLKDDYLNVGETKGSGSSLALNERAIPTLKTGQTVTRACLSLFAWFFAFNGLILFGFDQIYNREIWAISLLVLFSVLIILSVTVIYRMPQSPTKFGFMVPFVPVLPIVAIFANTFLMLKLSRITWARFTIWMIIGTIIYGFYGSLNSKAHIKQRTESETEVTSD